ncbi:hypothetical protein QOZ88_10195 [Blastococcus sp. BMG 814]|uniref:Integral membrane protein n=1 Tax=Blastococcus carthaginiensis TaxID=3050034 RepID=A0ABT9ID16_9ACTN|nr:hypothetical protein [Blastococcus carthaginiensis]MDP5183010.1 hypothetical protein [Blastococcus carthaginiensis]
MPGVALLFACLVTLQGRWAVWEGAAAWVAIGVLTAIVLIGQLVVLLSPRLRARSAGAHRIGHALRHRLDPGPELRERADVRARYQAGVGWLVWFVPLGPAGLPLGARWDRPVSTVPAALLVAGGAVGFVVWWRRRVEEARRWLADPPGPPREVPPPGRVERWSTRPRTALLAVAAVLVIGLLAGLVAGLTG